LPGGEKKKVKKREEKTDEVAFPRESRSKCSLSRHFKKGTTTSLTFRPMGKKQELNAQSIGSYAPMSNRDSGREEGRPKSLVKGSAELGWGEGTKKVIGL